MNDLYYQAMSTDRFSAVGEAAMFICIIRQLGADDLVFTPLGSLPRWQAIIFEQLLLKRIAG